MSRNPVRWRIAAVVISLAFVAAACGSDSDSSEDSSSGDTPTSVVDEVSDASGTLNWQTSWTIEQAEGYIKEFNKAYPNIEVAYTRSDDAAFVDKFTAEAESGKVTEDVVTVGYDGYLKEWNENGWLLDYESPEGETFPDEFKGADNSYYVNAQLLTGVCVNTDVLEAKGLEEPDSWEAINDPSYKGTIVMQDMFAVGSGANALTINLKGYWSKDGTDEAGITKWEDFFEALGKQEVVMQPSYTEAQQQLVQGNFAVMPVCYPDFIQPQIDQGAPVKWLAVDPVIPVLYGQGITKDGPNPEAGKAFQDFSLSEQGQKALVDIVQQVPTRPDIAYPASAKLAEGIPTYVALGPVWAQEENSCCIQEYTDQLKAWFGVA